MSEILLPSILLIIGLVILIKGADLLVDGSSALAKRMKISEIVIGLTIVSFGTSAPELIVNVLAAVNKKNEIVLGNIIGSNIFNLLLILGVAGVIYPISVKKNTVFKEIPFSFLAIILIFVLGNDNLFFKNSQNYLSILDGLILLILFFGFMYYIYTISKSDASSTEKKYQVMSGLKSIIFIVLGLIGLFGGGKLVVDSAVIIAQKLGVSEKLIALTIISGGTSLPELMTSAVAAFKKNSDIAIGNIVGSNIFNIFWILGLSALINPVKYDIVFNSDLAVLAGATLLLFLFMFTFSKNKLDRIESAIFLIIYLIYMAVIVYRA